MSYSKLWHLADESFIFSVSPALGKMPGPIAICIWVRNCRRRTAPFLDFFLTPVVLGRTVSHGFGGSQVVQHAPPGKMAVPLQ